MKYLSLNQHIESTHVEQPKTDTDFKMFTSFFGNPPTSVDTKNYVVISDTPSE